MSALDDSVRAAPQPVLPVAPDPALARLRRALGGEELWMVALLGVAALWLLIGVVLPLLQVISRSLVDRAGHPVGLANYREYFSSPGLSVSFTNSMTMATLTTIIAVTLAFAFAFAINRTRAPGKAFFGAVAMLPLYAPSLAIGVALVYLFGRKGLVTTALFGHLGVPGIDIHLYGLVGIVIGEVLFCFPQAFLILTVAMAISDARLHEAAESLRASPVRSFMTVTLPGLKFGLVSAVFVCFTLAFTDFGIPKVVGGGFNVLATDVYKQVIGQQNFVMGATISVLLLLPTSIAFVVDRIVRRRQVSLVSARTVPYRPRINPLADRLGLAMCALMTLAIVAPLLTVLLASLVDVWPYRMSLSLRHFNFDAVGGGGYTAYWNSLRMAFYTALAGVGVTLGSAYLIEKGRGVGWLRSTLYFLSTLPLALPGMVIGLAYIFFFNPTHWTVGPLQVPNPFSFLYGTMALLVICNIIHFYTVGFLTATTALKQLDPEFESISRSMGVPFYRTFWRVTLPLSLPAVLDIAVYYFVNALVTVSAVIFLYPPRLKLASVAIVNMDDAGDTAAAAALSVLLILTSIGVRMLYGLITRRMRARTQAWRAT